MRNYHMTVVVAVDKRCAASGRALQAESKRTKYNMGKYIFEKLCKIEANACTKAVCGDDFATKL